MKKITIGKKIKTAAWIVSAFYLALIIKLVFFKHPLAAVLDSVRGGGPRVPAAVNLEPFATIKLYLRVLPDSGFALENLLGNAALLLPFGLILPVIAPRLAGFFKIFAAAAVFSLSLELAQLILRIGSFDVDDLLLNTAGALVGYALYKISFNRPERNAS